MKISDFKVGAVVNGRLVLASASLRKTNSVKPKDFLNADLADGHDIINGKIWNYVVQGSLPETGKVYDIEATVGEYMNSKQLTISKMTLSADQDMFEFETQYDGYTSDMYRIAQGYISVIENEKLRNITKVIYDSYEAAIVGSTSAISVHHMGAGGNLAHSLQVVALSMCIADALKQFGYQANKDLIIAGALLHDIGKLPTYEKNGPAFKYSVDGILFDHIGNGLAILEAAALKFDSSYKDAFSLLGHIILSHHGKLEYGSPTTPKFIEAYIVSEADGISAMIDTLDAADKKATAEGKEITDRIFTLSNREHLTHALVLKMLGETLS